jgi:hypothetical protein
MPGGSRTNSGCGQKRWGLFGYVRSRNPLSANSQVLACFLLYVQNFVDIFVKSELFCIGLLLGRVPFRTPKVDTIGARSALLSREWAFSA